MFSEYQQKHWMSPLSLSALLSSTCKLRQPGEIKNAFALLVSQQGDFCCTFGIPNTIGDAVFMSSFWVRRAIQFHKRSSISLVAPNAIFSHPACSLPG
jgi:hypothetical protein